MKTALASDEPEPTIRVWPWHTTGTAPLNVNRFPDVTGALTVLPLTKISVASGAAAANTVILQ